MLKDIPKYKYKVKDVALAVVHENDEKGEELWNVYLLNFKEETINNVLVSSKGYGHFQGKQVKTTTLRHALNDVPAKGYKLVEPIIKSVLGLNNEYLVTFYIGKEIYDKRYIFLPESIKKENMITVPLINKPGVMIK